MLSQLLKHEISILKSLSDKTLLRKRTNIFWDDFQKMRKEADLCISLCLKELCGMRRRNILRLRLVVVLAPCGGKYHEKRHCQADNTLCLSGMNLLSAPILALNRLRLVTHWLCCPHIHKLFG